jgi:hypothetical protein
MGLGMGTQLDPQSRGATVHHGDIAIQDIDVDEKRWRWNIGPTHH